MKRRHWHLTKRAERHTKPLHVLGAPDRLSHALEQMAERWEKRLDKMEAERSAIDAMMIPSLWPIKESSHAKPR